MARNTLIFSSVNDGAAHEARIFNSAGAQVGAVVAATYVGAGTYQYFVTVPATLPTGWYAYSGYRTSNGRLRSSGEFYWDNADQCIVDTEENELAAADVEAAVSAALAADGIATAADVAASQAAIIANTDAAEATISALISALNNISAADVQAELATYDAATGTELQTCCNDILNAVSGLSIPTATAIATAVEAALLNEGDGQQVLNAIAQAVETALANEADGNATIATFQGAVNAALVAYDAATGADVTTCCNDIQTDIANLNNLSSADIVAALGTYGAATALDIDSAETAVLAAVSALQDLSAAQVTSIVQAELVAYDGTTQSSLDTAQNAIEALINSTAGLTVAQGAILTLIRDILEADEVYTNTTAQKLLKGTSTVLVDKTVTTATPCTIDTSIIEAP